MNRRQRTIVIAVAATVALLGCGSSGDDDATVDGTETTTSIAPADAGPTTELGQACADGSAAITAASADIVAGLDALKVASSRDEFEAALTDIRAAADAAVTAVEDFKASVEAIDVSENLTSALADFGEALDAQIAVAEDVVAAAAPGSDATESFASFNAALAEVQEADAVAREAATAAAEALDEPACVPEAFGGGPADDGGGSTTTTAG